MTRNIFKFLLFAATIAVLVSVFGVTVFADTRTVTAFGDCSRSNSDKVKWTLYSDGELIIEGKGEMADIPKEPWSSYREDITKVTVKEGVTYVGKDVVQVFCHFGYLQRFFI